MRTIFVLLLCVGTAFTATHVNISIAQHPATNPADVTYLEGTAPEELKAGPAKKPNGEERFARLRAADENDKAEKVEVKSEQKQEQGSSSVGNSKPAQQAQQSTEQSNGFRPQQQQRFYGRIRQQNRQSQFRQANAQDKQNQEFERYIQNYHSGPTVETVFETADHSPSGRYEYSSSSSSSAGPARLVAIDAKPSQQHTFERQVALPAAVATSASAAASVDEQSKSAPDAKIQISPAPVAAQPAVAAPVAVHASAPAVSGAAVVPTGPSKAVTTVHSGSSDGGKIHLGGTFGNSFGGAGSGSPGVTFRVAGGGGYSPPNYDQVPSYAKPDYGQPSFGYDHGDAGGFLNEYPPSVDEPAGGYDGFYGNQEHDYHSNGGYLPVNPNVYQRPVVTKTIQIAQPALKAKKFEVRHPAIQKEFYDIEERVVIKPAGTIVVELEHPVAKIPKGETVLPLGHPHPAIAAQYNINSDADIETESSSAGSYNNGVRSNSNQVYASAARKNPAPVISGTNIASTVTATPTNNPNAKRDFVEANLRKQYGEEAKLIAPTDSALGEQNSRGRNFYIPAESHDSQRQVPNRNFSPNTFRREESNYQRPARVEAQQNGQVYQPRYSKNEEQSLKNTSPDVPNDFNNDDDEYKGEYITGNFYSASKDPKPARLQEEPAKSERITAEPQTRIIKHEHTINLPPSQHNIYLAPSRFEERQVLVQAQRKQAPSAKQQPAHLEEEPARVSEVKSFLNRQRDGVVVYAVPARRPVPAQQRYTQNERRQPQYVAPQRTYEQLRYDPDADVDSAAVEYSAPYSHMRYDPNESARLTADVEYQRGSNEKVPQRTITVHYNRGPESNARLTAQNKSESDSKEPAKIAESNEDVRPKTEDIRPLAHIQLQVPYGPQEADEPIRVMSSINPPKERSRTAKVSQPEAKKAVDEQVEDVNAESAPEPSAKQEEDVLRSENIEAQPDCAQNTEKVSARYENPQPSDNENVQYVAEPQNRVQIKSQRLIDTSNSNANSKENVKSAPSDAESIDTNGKDASSQATPPGSRVIAANPAPNDASATSESFHKRRIVVNHPFQTVREVVEHEPITNYHQIQVHERASPTSAYNKAPYFAPNGQLRQFEMVRVPVMYHQPSGVTHGNLVYALPDAIPVHEDNGEVEPSYQQRRQRVRA
ncbi:uncharacterized protein LOC105225027 [Bactrocera dorsalis]|uniref:Uncharacterized protein LOC105225027 n=1 Tax=Bactrocera dorsalis TaxID=27457 RepID=A0A6I9V023_BACDO|nr:uncharacterized protein LOC105225027 [Bactrocera dorsalis]